MCRPSDAHAHNREIEGGLLDAHDTVDRRKGDDSRDVLPGLDDALEWRTPTPTVPLGFEPLPTAALFGGTLLGAALASLGPGLATATAESRGASFAGAGNGGVPKEHGSRNKLLIRSAGRLARANDYVANRTLRRVTSTALALLRTAPVLPLRARAG